VTYPLLIDKIRNIVTMCRDAQFPARNRYVMFVGPAGTGANHGALWDREDHSFWGGFYYYDDPNWLMLELVYEFADERPDPLGARDWLPRPGGVGGYLAYVAARTGNAEDRDGVLRFEWAADHFYQLNDNDVVAQLLNVLPKGGG
jgi:hypothetical protein